MPRPARTDPRQERRPTRGASLPELVLVLAVIGIVAGGAWQALSAFGAARSSREAARGVAADLRAIALDARRQRRSLAVDFDLGEPSRWRVLADGNGNGVTSADVSAGIDPALTAWRPVLREGRARLAVMRDLPSADGAGTLPAGSSPVQLGVMSRLVFTPHGTATAGSIYLAGAGGGGAYAIRVLGSTQRIRLSCLSRNDVWEPC